MSTERLFPAACGCAAPKAIYELMENFLTLQRRGGFVESFRMANQVGKFYF